jgi:RNA recognition motif-containing protein
MAKKIYVGNLSYNTSDDTLRQAFAAYGEVAECATIIDKFTNNSKGFAFVTMADEQAAQAAIAGMNGKSVDGRQLRVSEANPKPAGDRGDRGGYSGNRW